MYKIVKEKKLSENIVLMDVEAPMIANSCEPGQFVIARITEEGERIPLTICDYDREKGTITIVFQIVGASTERMSSIEVGDELQDFVGPLGCASELVEMDPAELAKKKILFVAGGVGAAPVYPQVKWLHEQGVQADVILGARSKDLIILEEELRAVSGNLYVTTDDGSYGQKGVVTSVIEELVNEKGQQYDLCVAIGPMIMMKFVCMTTKKMGIKTIVSMNPIMVDGTGMCGACRVLVDGKVKFACVDGPEFDGHALDFNQAIKRAQMYKTEEGRAYLRVKEGTTHHGGCGNCVDDEAEKAAGRKRVPVREQDAQMRAHNMEEVCYGYNEDEAVREANRCLNCKNARCVGGCPVAIDIPAFIDQVKKKDFAKAYEIISEASFLPSICGRVCPQESQCEGQCVLGIKGDPIAIGKLERFVADWARKHGIHPEEATEKKSQKVAIVGSGPAGLTCAGELAKKGYQVTIFEALHEVGGVLTYGIPEFRLPKEKVVLPEVKNLEKLGVDIQTNVVIGKTFLIEDLMETEGFDAVFIGTGAGLPKFMGIPGENANGVVSANEYLTRNNLMKAFRNDSDTLITKAKKVAVVGGGNVAMDAARMALRLGAETHIVYRRSEEELPARREEVEHAKEEGVIFDLLCNPKIIFETEKGWVKSVMCVRMQLGEADESGRRRPEEIPGSEFLLDADMVIMALGTDANPLVPSTTEGLETNKRHGICAEDNGQTSKEGVFAGGDAVSGSATVILAMEAGKKAAKGIEEYLESKTK